MADHHQVPVTAAAVEAAPPDQAFDLLQDPERRELLAILGQLETPERVSALTRSLATAYDGLDEGDVDRLGIRLYHTHVPKLEDAGLVSHDEAEDTVVLTERGETLADVLAAARSD